MMEQQPRLQAGQPTTTYVQPPIPTGLAQLTQASPSLQAGQPTTTYLQPPIQTGLVQLTQASGAACSLFFEDLQNAQANTALLDEAWRCRTCLKPVGGHPKRPLPSPGQSSTAALNPALGQSQPQLLNDEGAPVWLMYEGGGRYYCKRDVLKEPTRLTSLVRHYTTNQIGCDCLTVNTRCGTNFHRCMSCTRFNENKLFIRDKLHSPSEVLATKEGKDYIGDLELLHCDTCNLYVDPFVSHELNMFQYLVNLIACPLQMCFTTDVHKCPGCDKTLKTNSCKCRCCCWLPAPED